MRLLMAQAVAPNAKCGGCLNYDQNRGEYGACLVGLRPNVCGNGEHPEMGYAPMGGAATAPMGHTPIAQSGVPGPVNATPEVKVISLGEEHVDMVKSLDHLLTDNSMCRAHLRGGQGAGQVSRSVPHGFACQCRDVTDIEIAKSLYKQLNNRVKHVIGQTFEQAQTLLVSFVNHARHYDDIDSVRKGILSELGYKPPAVSTKPSPGGKKPGGIKFSKEQRDRAMGAVLAQAQLPRMQKSLHFTPYRGAHNAQTEHGSYRIQKQHTGTHRLEYATKTQGFKTLSTHPSMDHAKAAAFDHHKKMK